MARGLGFKAKVRQGILRRRDSVRGGKGRIKPKPEPVRDPKKTLAMHLLELQHGKSLEELIATGGIREIGNTLGIARSTVSVWRKRLGLR